jgi:23S rRNA pseudouridine1911/1915/1917 synthase
LFERFSGLSKMYIRDVIKSGSCEVNGRCENRGFRVRHNVFIEIGLDMSRSAAMTAENVTLNIAYEDDAIVVVEKPAGMLVHPTHRDRNGTLLNALSYHINGGHSEGFIRPGLVHRLDRETSGLMIVAKNQAAHRVLSSHFRRKMVEKRYAAIVAGSVTADSRSILAPISRVHHEKYWAVTENGKPSETRFRVIERSHGQTLLELEPVTGRTNQLRIHCAHIGHPILGDTQRGGPAHERLCLHSSFLALNHPTTGERLCFTSDKPFRLTLHGT